MRRTLFPATLPFDRPPARLDQLEARGRTPFYVLAWRIPFMDLALFPREYRGIGEWYNNEWYATKQKHGIKQQLREPYVQDRVRPGDKDDDVIYFIIATNRRKSDLTPDSLDIHVAKEPLLDVYEPMDNPDVQLGDPIWYRVGSFEDQVLSTTA
ncbi:hypothetical protein MIND_01082000 [Mycena indigotica]|uniref:Uncharacterized protein n=1 Tax=Mycena indigotica TaxID=2126181 RepID=A0A8H6VVF7_9AGAR|nr:uncharacterized protein MIND_01082000 [Mycena indigotica]KAF7295424.1 hypothetical protein MIND_01082000 [Mycena indigotica]